MAGRRTNREERLLQIEQMLLHHSAGLRVIEIANACDVDRRTIYRDLALLVDSGLPLQQHDGRFYLDRVHYAASLRLRFHEAVALFLATRSWSLRSDQPNPHMASALRKIAEILPQSIQSYVSQLSNDVQDQAVNAAFVKVLETLTQAWAELLDVRLWHQDAQAGKTYEHRFATYAIEPGTRSEVYATGFDYAGQKIVTLNLYSVKRIELLDSHYKIPENLDHHTLPRKPARTHSQPTEVVLLFSAQIVPLLKQKSGRLSQELIVMDEDKRGLLSLQVEDSKSLLPWIRSWGEHVEVVKPKSLRDQIAREAVRVAAVHSGQ